MAGTRISTTLAFAAGLAALAPVSALAGPYAGYVIAYSHYGNGTVEGPVRIAELGPQVKLPGGPWIYCERNSLFLSRADPCSETLRRQSVDFWETMSEEQGGRR